MFHLEPEEKWKGRLFCSAASATISLVTAARDRSANTGNSVVYSVFGIGTALGMAWAFDF